MNGCVAIKVNLAAQLNKNELAVAVDVVAACRLKFVAYRVGKTCEQLAAYGLDALAVLVVEIESGQWVAAPPFERLVLNTTTQNELRY